MAGLDRKHSVDPLQVGADRAIGKRLSKAPAPDDGPAAPDVIDVAVGDGAIFVADRAQHLRCHHHSDTHTRFILGAFEIDVASDGDPARGFDFFGFACELGGDFVFVVFDHFGP